MNIKLNKNAKLNKILDSLIDILFNDKTVSDDLSNFLNLFALDVSDIEYMTNDSQHIYDNNNSYIYESIYSKISKLTMKKNYSFFLDDYSNDELTESLNKIILITNIYQRFYTKIDSLDFLISIRYLSYDYGAFLYDIDGEQEYRLTNYGELNTSNLKPEIIKSTNNPITNYDKSKHENINLPNEYKSIFNFYEPNIFYEENDSLKKATNWNQLKNCKYYYINKLDLILEKCTLDSTTTIEYDISKEVVSFLNISDLKEASFEQITECISTSLRNSKKPKSLEGGTSFYDTNFNNFYSYFNNLFSISEKEYRDYIVNLVNTIINRHYAKTTSSFSRLIVIGYICSELDIGIKEKTIESDTKYHTYLKDTIKNIILKANINRDN